MDNQYFKDLLKSRHLKATNNRLELLTNMQAYASAIPYSLLQKRIPKMDRVTLYRTVDTLTKQGIIHEAYRENNETYYAICGKKCDEHHHHHDHVHFKCNQCKKVTCQDIDTQNSLKIKLPNHDILKVAIHVEGICPTCIIV